MTCGCVLKIKENVINVGDPQRTDSFKRIILKLSFQKE